MDIGNPPTILPSNFGFGENPVGPPIGERKFASIFIKNKIKNRLR